MLIELVEEAYGDKSVMRIDTQLTQTLWKGGYIKGVQRKCSVRQVTCRKGMGLYRHRGQCFGIFWQTGPLRLLPLKHFRT